MCSSELLCFREDKIVNCEIPADPVLTSLRRSERTGDRSNPNIGAKTQDRDSLKALVCTVNSERPD